MYVVRCVGSPSLVKDVDRLVCGSLGGRAKPLEIRINVLSE